MKKNSYISPEVKVYEMEGMEMLALSVTDGTANPDSEVLSNEHDEKFTDIWSDIY